MTASPSVASRLAFTLVVGLSLLLCTGCEYEIPLTAKPTRKPQETLVGTWRATSSQDLMKVRRLDDASYVVTYNGDLYSAHHSDLASTPFVSVLHLDPANRKYSILAWSLSADGGRLQLRVVNSKVIPAHTRDPVTLQKLIRENLGNPVLFASEHHYVREK